MTIIKNNIRALDVKQEVRQIREAARKVASSKESARLFLISTGMYTSSGQLKPQFR